MNLINNYRYSRAVRNTFIVGKHLAKFIQFLVTNGAPIENFHLLGFSLGAHAIGNAGKILQENGLRIKRITGMFPLITSWELKNS